MRKNLYMSRLMTQDVNYGSCRCRVAEDFYAAFRHGVSDKMSPHETTDQITVLKHCFDRDLVMVGCPENGIRGCYNQWYSHTTAHKDYDCQAFDWQVFGGHNEIIRGSFITAM